MSIFSAFFYCSDQVRFLGPSLAGHSDLSPKIKEQETWGVEDVGSA